MSRWAVLLSGLIALLATGCLSEEPIRRSQWVERFRRFNCSDSTRLVQLEVGLIERPVADHYINKDVWEHTDKWVLQSDKEAFELDRQALIEKNGFCVGQVVGALPSRLQSLLTSKRSCAKSRRMVWAVGKKTVIRLGPFMQTCRFEAELENGTSAFELPHAQCQFSVMATPTKDGRTRLKFTPRVEYGNVQKHLRADPEHSRWEQKYQRPTKLFPELSWEVTLADNEMLLIGTLLDQPWSLGFQTFIDRTTNAPVQRLLVLRIKRSGVTGVDAELPQSEHQLPQSSSKVLPLALQASKMTVRGYRE